MITQIEVFFNFWHISIKGNTKIQFNSIDENGVTIRMALHLPCRGISSRRGAGSFR